MKLAHQIALLLFATVLVTVVAMGALVGFNLNRGFVDYLQLRQLAHFDDIEKRLIAEARLHGSLEHLRDRPRTWRTILAAEKGDAVAARNTPEEPRPEEGADDFRPPHEEPPQKGPPPKGPPREGPPPGEPPPWRDVRKPPPKSGPPAGGKGLKAGKEDPLGLGPRFHLYDAARRPMHPQLPAPPVDSAPPIERAIAVGNTIVGYVVHTPVAKAPPAADDAVFLRKQLIAIGVAGAALLGLALLFAPWVARRWSRPIDQVSDAAARIAKGAFDVRLPDDRPDEIGGLMRNINAMAGALADLERARKRWIAESAHELRTPLAVLRGEIEALQDGVRTFDGHALGSLADEVRHLTKLVNDLHLLSLADMGALPCTMVRTDVADVARRVVARFRPLAERRRLSLDAVLPDAAPLVADDDRIEQLLNNLIENSLRYTDAPGRIVLRVESGGSGVTVTVEDTAPGVPAAECEKLFEPLYRADAARSREAGGSGLGLAICRAIVQAHGGHITARPSFMGGLAVTAIFPSVSSLSMHAP